MTENKVQLEYANESAAAYLPDAEAFEDRQHFVINLGILLSQTREGVKSLYLTDDDFVHVIYKDGSKERLIDVAMDSYNAIIQDVSSQI